MTVKTRTFFQAVSLSLVALALGGCSLIGTRADSTNDPSIDPIVEAAAQVRAESGENLIAIENPDAARALQQEQQDQQDAMIRQALKSGDVTLGMGMEDVLRSWGEPRSVDTAGDPRSGNQRWVYYDGLSSRWGMSQKRILYFERGRLVGWETAR